MAFMPRPSPEVTSFFDAASNTVSYVVADPRTKICAVIDTVLDYDAASGRTGKTSANTIIRFIREQGLTLDWILETHVHADHLSAAPYIQGELGGRMGIGRGIIEVQEIFGKLFNAGTAFQRNGSQFDRLFDDGDTFEIGSITATAWHTPGHTPACMSFIVGDAVFVGDTIFMHDFGTARTDFPGGDARTLYRSIRRLFTLPPETRVFLCHDYKAPGREAFCWETTIGEARALNVHIKDGIDEETFVKMRERRDGELSVPKLILPSVQINMRAGDLPPPEENGTRYIKIPIDAI